jgi:hypothetical protein
VSCGFQHVVHRRFHRRNAPAVSEIARGNERSANLFLGRGLAECLDCIEQGVGFVSGHAGSFFGWAKRSRMALSLASTSGDGLDGSDIRLRSSRRTSL